MLRKMKGLMMVLTAGSLLAAAGCSSMRSGGGSDDMGGSGMDDMGSDMPMGVNEDSDSGSAMGLRTVNFAYNSAALGDGARMVLEENASILRDNPSVMVTVEGHCDERGGVQYNLALGERRAGAVRDYLVAMGVSGSQLSTLSFGKERPLAFGHDEMSWSQNRRANFVITSK